MNEQIETIHESLVNGQRRQMVQQINEYGTYDFWTDYRDWLHDYAADRAAAYRFFADAVISYHRISGR